MKIAIVYKSLTGNTFMIAEKIEHYCGDRVVYFGEPQANIEADLFFVGSWTDKGSCCDEIKEFIKTLNHTTIAYFGTAGFGGSLDYYKAIEERIKSFVHPSNQWKDSFFCQGKMPYAIKDRYLALLQQHPDDHRLQVSLQNFDEALSHPNDDDFQRLQQWVLNVLK